MVTSDSRVARTSPNREESTNLDVLRAIAVSCVFVSHLPDVVDRNLGFISARQLGVGGVLLFFVHTSCVLLMSLERSKAHRQCLNFYIRRAFRIYPLSIVCVFSVVALGIGPKGVTSTYHWIGYKALAANVLLIQNLTHAPNIPHQLWSLPWEVQMYILLPFIYLYLVRSRAPSVAILLLWIASLAISFLGFFASQLFFLHAATFPALFLGGALAYQLGKTLAPRIPAAVWAPAVLALILLRGVALESGEDFFSPRNTLVNACTCLLLGFMIPCFENLPASLLTKSAHTIAKYSYGIYLFHGHAIWYAFKTLAHSPWAVQWLALAILVTIIPIATYHLVEKPMIDLGRQLAAISDRRASAQGVAWRLPKRANLV